MIPTKEIAGPGGTTLKIPDLNPGPAAQLAQPGQSKIRIRAVQEGGPREPKPGWVTGKKPTERPNILGLPVSYGPDQPIALHLIVTPTEALAVLDHSLAPQVLELDAKVGTLLAERGKFSQQTLLAEKRAADLKYHEDPSAENLQRMRAAQERYLDCRALKFIASQQAISAAAKKFFADHIAPLHRKLALPIFQELKTEVDLLAEGEESIFLHYGLCWEPSKVVRCLRLSVSIFERAIEGFAGNIGGPNPLRNFLKSVGLRVKADATGFERIPEGELEQ